MESTGTFDFVNSIANEGELVYTVVSSQMLLQYLTLELESVGKIQGDVLLFPSQDPFPFTINEIQYYGLSLKNDYHYKDERGKYLGCHIIFSKAHTDFDALDKFLSEKHGDKTKVNPCKIKNWSPSHGRYLDSNYEIENKTQDSLIGLDHFFNSMERDIKSISEREGLAKKLGADSGFNYLIYGEPGTGKSSAVKALAHKLGLPAYCANLTNIPQQHIQYVLSPNDGKRHSDYDDYGEEIIDVAEKKAKTEIKIVLIEDFDRYIKGQVGNRNYMSDLLNALDGLHSSIGCIRIFSANFPENVLLDTALRSRLTRMIKFEMPSSDTILKHIVQVFPQNVAEAEEFVKLLENKKMSIREIDGYLSRFIMDDNPLKEAITGFSKWIEEIAQIEELKKSKEEKAAKKEAKDKNKSKQVSALMAAASQLQYGNDDNDSGGDNDDSGSDNTE